MMAWWLIIHLMVMLMIGNGHFMIRDPDNKDIITSYALTRNKWEHYTIVKRKLNIELFVNATSVFFNFS
jgi:hypothetical protein